MRNFPVYDDGRLNHDEAVRLWIQNERDTLTKTAFAQSGFFLNATYLLEGVHCSLDNMNEAGIRKGLLSSSEELPEAEIKGDELWEDTKAERFRLFSRALERLFNAPCPPELSDLKEELSTRIIDNVSAGLNRKGYLPQGRIDMIREWIAEYCDPTDEFWGENLMGSAIGNRYYLLLENIGNTLEAYHNHRNGNIGQFPSFDEEFKSDILVFAKKYLSEPLMHAPEITNFIAGAVLNTEIYPLERDVNNPAILMMHASSGYRPTAINEIHGNSKIGQSLFYTSILTVVIKVAGDYYEKFWIGNWAIGLFATYAIFQFLKFGGYNSMKESLKGSLNGVLQDLQLIYYEINVNSYDAERLSERLREIEVSGGNVPSIMYSLLKLHK